jgi:3-deoxy-D-manno-octulosonate 8-phosphate phosphatase (KDO 8-P phosphatase)
MKIETELTNLGGVFVKTAEQIPSSFSEADSMGTNLLRFAFWLRHGKIPPVAIITGAVNPTAVELANRERFSAVYTQIVFKEEAIRHFCQWQEIEPSEVACFFDDANDLGMARVCGLRFLMRRRATPLFAHIVRKNHLCDYITAQEGGEHALREVCELMMQLNGQYEKTILERANFTPAYQRYYKERQEGKAQFFRKEGNFFVEMEG